MNTVKALGFMGIFMGMMGGCATTNRARESATQLGDALGMFRVNNSRYPTTEEGLYVLISSPPTLKHTWRGPYTQVKSLRDPWNNVYRYEAVGDGYRLKSAGPDGQVGNADDVVYDFSSSSSS